MFRLLFCLGFSAQIIFAERKLPSYVQVCKRNDPNLSQCWQDTLLNLRPYLTKGIAEFNIDPITNFQVEKIHLNQGNTRNMRFVADLYNLSFTGGEHYQVPYTDVNFSDLQDIYINEGITYPKLKMKGQYKGKGTVLLFELESEGDIEGEFEDVKINGTWHLKLTKKKGKNHLSIIKDFIDVQPGKVYLYLHDLMKNNPEITKNINNAINENMDLLYDDFKPLLEQTMSVYLNRYLNRVYSLYPFDVLFPPE